MCVRSFLLSSALASILASGAMAENPVLIDDARGGGIPANIGLQEQG